MLRSVLESIVLSGVLAMGALSLHGCGKVDQTSDAASEIAASESPQSAAAGTYDLDPAGVRAAIEQQIEQLEDPSEQFTMQMMLGFVDSMSMSITLNEDGTASGISSMMDETQHGTGTWTLDGEAISISLASEGEQPDTLSGTIHNGRIELSDPDDESGMAFKLVFNKRADG